jgi:hypothetical protein
MSEPFAPSPLLDSDQPPAATVSAFLPLLILGLAILVWFGFQATQLRVERDAMRTGITNQDKAVQDSKKLRDALDALARGTAQLADGGNPNARLVVDELKKRGITITPDQPAAGAAPTTPAPAK